MQQDGERVRWFRLPRWTLSALLAVSSIAVSAEAAKLGIGHLSQPGPGFFPLLLSALVAATIAAIAFQSAPARTDSAVSPLSVKVFLALCFYGVLFIPLGFILATFIFFSLETRIIEGASWISSVLRGVLVAATAYGLFTLLGVQLPQGLWLG